MERALLAEAVRVSVVQDASTRGPLAGRASIAPPASCTLSELVSTQERNTSPTRCWAASERLPPNGAHTLLCTGRVKHRAGLQRLPAIWLPLWKSLSLTALQLAGRMLQ